MTTEQLLINSWRTLSGDKQQVVIDFVEFLKTRPAQNDVEDKKHTDCTRVESSQN